MAKTQRQEVDLFGESVEYEVRYSSDATKPRIDVDIHGVTVVVPESEEVPPAELLKENAAWVTEKTRQYDAYREEIPERHFEKGAVFPYLGEDHEIVIEKRSSSSIETGKFRLAKHHVEEKSIKRALETLYRRKAGETFEERADHFAAEMSVEYEQMEIRRQRTRWGSCSTTGTLGLNWRLMMAPMEIIDYIVIHELAHLRVSDHTDSFWNLVAEYDPDYEDHARWLEENSVKLIFSEADL
jgi:predicted metal-dependent hydrolase